MAASKHRNAGPPDDMEAVYICITGHLKLSPNCVRKIVDKECEDKHSTETYKDYCERLQGSAFEYGKWKKLCKFFWKMFETDTNPNNMNITGLCNLLYVLHKMKNKSVPESFIKALKDLKDLRKGVMYNYVSASDPAALGKLKAAIIAFIQEAESFYSLSNNEVQGLRHQLESDIQALVSSDSAKLVKEGWTTMKHFLETNFEVSNLMLNLGKVERTEVFHELEIVQKEGMDGSCFPYSKILEHPEKFIIVSGAAGAGKSTLLKNIALQYVKPQPGTSVHLKDFQLLVYIQCRDHTALTLSDVMSRQFPDVRLGKDKILKALFELSALFLLDGYDEYGQKMTVLQEVIKGTWRSNCRVIITSRLHAVPHLRKLLSNENVNYFEFEIAPLTKLEQQLNFLRKYESHLPGFLPSGAVQKSFETLEEPLRILFTEPRSLLQFCSVCIRCPEKIPTWRRAADVAKSTNPIYRDLVTNKLTNSSYPGLDIVIDNLFLVVYEAALDFLLANTMTFTEGQFKQLRRKCHKMLLNEHAISDLDIEKVLSCIFKMKRPPSGTGDSTYSFNHIGDHEYFAAKCVVHKIENNKVSLRKILFGENSPANDRTRWRRFLEVLQYVVQDLSADRPDLFEQRWPQLKETLQEEGADFSAWRDVVLSCSSDASGVKKVAEVAKIAARNKWEISDGRGVVAAARMLPHAQPSRLEVRSSPHQLRGASWDVAPPREGAHQPWEEVVRLRKGELWLWLSLDTPCDDLLTTLHDTRAQLVWFSGGIAESASVAALSSAATPWSYLTVRLLAPLSLSALQGRCWSLMVYVRPFAAADGGPWPLPARRRPELLVTDVQPGAWRDVVHTVQSFAPHHNRYASLALHPCHLSEGDLDRTVAALQRRGIMTEWGDDGPTRWQRSDSFTGPGFWLYITDELPERLAQLE